MSGLTDFVKNLVELETEKISGEKALDKACENLANDNSAANRDAVDQAYDQIWKNVGNAANNVVPDAIAQEISKGITNNVVEAGLAISGQRKKNIQDVLEKAGLQKIGELQRDKCREQSDKFRQSQSLPPPRIDPLAIDLDGDGVETIATTESVLFDHDGDGIKTASGWVKGDDGFLVIDNNGNGQIDNGSELFGADTVLSDGQKATDGFQALAARDSNGNGQIDAGDSAFQSLRIWRDIDQDGISQADELFSLSDVGISSISLAQMTHNQDLGNGNELLATASVTYTDGSTTTAASLALAEDKFNSEYVDAITVSAEALALPSMTGMGLVRNLSESATLSSAMLSVLSQYATASTVFDQKNLLDPLVSEWANTVAVPSQEVAYEFAGIQHYVNNDANAGETEAYQTMLQKLHVLEVFNGEPFAGSGVANLTLFAGQVTLLNQAYDSLKEGVYSSLLSQTLLKPYYDAIEYVGGEPLPHLDYSGVVALRMSLSRTTLNSQPRFAAYLVAAAHFNWFSSSFSLRGGMRRRGDSEASFKSGFTSQSTDGQFADSAKSPW